MVKKLVAALSCALVLLPGAALAQALTVTRSTQPYVALTGATNSNLADDDEGLLIPLAFGFPFYGVTYTHVMITTNGLVIPSAAGNTTCASSGCFSNVGLPSTGTPNPSIAGVWDDLSTFSAGSIRYISTPAEFAVEWSAVPRLSFPSATVTFQVRLNPSGSFTVHYGPITGVSSDWSFSAGFENGTGTVGQNFFTCTSSCSIADYPPVGTLITVGEPNEADLVVPSVTIANFATAQDGNLSFDVQASLRNVGRTPASNFGWRAFLSRDQVLDLDAGVDGGAADIEVAQGGPVSLPGVDGGVTADGGQALISVSGGASTTTAPPPGEYFVLVQADPGNVVVEASETNNVGSTATAFVQGTDLVAQGISGPANTGGGNVENLQVQFFNRGTTSAGTVSFRILLSVDAVLDASDFAAFTGTRTVTGGQTINETIPVTMPANVPNGQFYWLLQLDPSNAITEANETNNVAASSARVDVRRADLVIESVSFVDPLTGLAATSGRFGDPVRMTVRFRNAGGANANNFRVAMVLSSDTSLSLLSDTYVCDQVVASVTPTAPSTEVTLNCPLPTENAARMAFATGPYFFYGVLDPAGAIFESNKVNNSMVVGPVRLSAPGPDLQVASVTAPAAAGVGEIIPVVRTLRNAGNVDAASATYRYYASANEIITPDDVPLPIVANGQERLDGQVTLARGASHGATELVRLPGVMPAGTYYVGCIIDPAGMVAGELDVSNNALGSRPMVVAPSSLRIVNTALPDAVVGRPYAFRLAVTGEQGPSTWRIDPLLGTSPAWLSLSADGLLTGTPPGTGGQAAVGVTVVVENAGRQAAARLALRVLPSTTGLEVITPALPAVVNSSASVYQFKLGAAGGVFPYTWRLASGTLPTGMALAPDGTLFGSPRNAANGALPLTIEVRDAVGARASRPLALRLIPAGSLTFNTVFVPDALVGQEYLQDIAVGMQDGSLLARPLTWRVSGAVPPGLVATPQAELITLGGRPTLSGTFTFSVSVEDANGRSDSLEFTMTVHPPRSRVVTPMPDVLRPGDVVNLQLVAAPTSSTTRYRVVAGTLAPGLTLDAAGLLSGTVALDGAEGQWAFLVETADATGMAGLTALSLRVERQPRTQGCSAVAGGPLGLVLAALVLRRRRAKA